MQRQFRAMPAQALRIVPLDTLTLIYHRASGITHLVASPAPEILDALAAGPMNRTQLLAALNDRYDLDDSSEAALAVRLDELIAAGLVEPL